MQNKDGWLLHPLDEELRKTAPTGKLRSIPVRMLFNDPDLNLRAEYSAFDRQTGRPFCVGNGESCRRSTDTGIQTFPCPSPKACSLGKNGLCKPYGRLHVKIGDDDEVGTFIFRTTGFNSIRTLAARLSYYRAVSGNLLACLPLQLRLRGKSTTQSHRTPIYYVDLTIREGLTLEQSIVETRTITQRRQETGFDQAALDEAAQNGFGNVAFEFSEDENPEVLEEFYPKDQGEHVDMPVDISPGISSTPSKTGLIGKLEQKSIALNTQAG